MSQFGMQMPGGRAQRAASPDVYTGLLFLAVAALATACVVVFMQGSKIGPDGSAMGLQESGNIKIKEAAR